MGPEQALRWCQDVGRGLEALRLNRQYPPWDAIRDHVAAVGVPQPEGCRLALCPTTGWPHPSEWLRVRVDHRLAPDLLERIRHIEAAGDPLAIAKATYLRAMAACRPLQDGELRVALVRREAEGVRFQVVLDRLETGLPAFVRWTIRLLDRGARSFAADEMAPRAHASFTRRLVALTSQPVPEAMVLLAADADLEVEEMIRGEVGPLLESEAGPMVTAGLGRAAPTLQGVGVDDPLQDRIHVPSALAGFGYTFQRKWAVPRVAVDATTAWLRKLGSKGVVYGY